MRPRFHASGARNATNTAVTIQRFSMSLVSVWLEAGMASSACEPGAAELAAAGGACERGAAPAAPAAGKEPATADGNAKLGRAGAAASAEAPVSNVNGGKVVSDVSAELD